MFRSTTMRYACLLTFAVSSLLVASQESTESLVPLRTHSIYAPYVDQDLQNRWFDFGGEAYVNTNKHIRLTQDRPSETGYLWSRLPITVSNYQIDVEFKISGASGHLFGDGMAIWITKSRAVFGTVFGSKDKFEGVGIFIDTYANSRHSYSFPRVVGMIGDGNTEYDHEHDGDATSKGACSASVRRNDIKTMARIIYKKDQSLQVLLQYKGWDEWTPCFEIKNVTLPSMPYLGFSAITGEVHDAHDIISVSTSSIIVNKAGSSKNGIKLGSGPHGSSESTGSWIGSLFKLLVFVGICGGLYQAYVVYFVQHGRWSNKSF